MTATATTTPVATPSTTNQTQYPQWETMLLQGWGAPLNDASYQALTLWAQSEGVSNKNNPLAISGVFPGATTCLAQCGGTSPIYAYDTMEDGIAATVQFTQGSNSASIVAAFKQGLNINQIYAAINGSAWCRGCQGGNYPIDLFHGLNNPTGLTGQALHVLGDVVNPGDIAGKALSAALTVPTAELTILKELTSRTFYLRVGEFLLGLGLVAAGLVLFVATSKGGEKIIGDTAKAGAVAAVA